MKGKAALIYPTGAGESFIGFNYAKISPTDYNFKLILKNRNYYPARYRQLVGATVNAQ